MKTCLVTGGAGFLGSHLCTFLLEKGFKVICVDNLITGKTSNVDHIKNNENFVYLEHNIIIPLTVRGRIDYILNFASPASPIDYQKIPIPTLDVGAFGTRNLLELAKLKKAVFLQASTSEVYGDPLVNPQPESYWGNVNPIGVRSCYDEAKRFAEALVMAFHRSYDLDTKIVRIFNTYGPRMRANDGRVVPAFITQALENKTLTVFGDGEQTRSFCFVDDLIKGIYALMLSDLHEPVNIGNPDEYTVLELANKIIALTNSKSTIEFHGLPEDDPKFRRPDITLAKQQLGWVPKVSLEDGLHKTIDWFSS
ncbi:NAD-dependent dehydratase [Candidatus Woesearchaeota archaeon CG10_big_fil_rev_8_21_14_0_10_34_8]|nr:MAG: NAD-dependent dehydratase [Candidatus Woesearchaeota archaeon CG10_big_fil_rev_8_21_14_0_10_34_8]